MTVEDLYPTLSFRRVYRHVPGGGIIYRVEQKYFSPLAPDTAWIPITGFRDYPCPAKIQFPSNTPCSPEALYRVNAWLREMFGVAGPPDGHISYAGERFL